MQFILGLLMYGCTMSDVNEYIGYNSVNDENINANVNVNAVVNIIVNAIVNIINANTIVNTINVNTKCLINTMLGLNGL